MNSNQPLAASGERRVGTIGNITSRIAQSLTISSVVQKPVVSMLGI
jgi:uroporphyrinogen-III synthase